MVFSAYSQQASAQIGEEVDSSRNQRLSQIEDYWLQADKGYSHKLGTALCVATTEHREGTTRDIANSQLVSPTHRPSGSTLCNGVREILFAAKQKATWLTTSLNLRTRSAWRGHMWCDLTLYLTYVTISMKTVPNGTFDISRNTILKHWSHCSSLVLYFSHARFTV